MKCLTLSQLIAFDNQPISNVNMQLHLRSCSKCKKALDEYRGFARFIIANMPDKRQTASEKCRDDSALLSYLEGGIRRKSRQELFHHLAQCEMCTTRLIQLENLLHELKAEGALAMQPNLQERVWKLMDTAVGTTKDKIKQFSDALLLPKPTYAWVSLAGILIVAGLSLILTDLHEYAPFITREPSASRSAVEIELLEPAERASVAGSNPEFSWAGSPDVTVYTFTLVNADGEIIWEKRTSENSLSLPTTVILESSMMYFWQVEGHFHYGGSVLSEMISFAYEPE